MREDTMLSSTRAELHQQIKTMNKGVPDHQKSARAWAIYFGDKNARLQLQQDQNRLAVECAQPVIHWVVPSENDQPAVDLCVYKPKNATAKLLIIYFIPGDGYGVGNAKMLSDSLQDLAVLQQAAVVNVEYKLATEAPFLADLNDVYLGLGYVFRNAVGFGLDNERVVFMSERSGGGLTARFALYTRDNREFAPKWQVLIYPMLNHRTDTEASPYHNETAGECVWTAKANCYGWENLRGDKEIIILQTLYFSPTMLNNLEVLPNTFIMVGEMDLFVNEYIDHANRLIHSGVSPKLHFTPDFFHAFNMVNPTAKETILKFARVRIMIC